jgi:hypothetical protein
MYRDKDHICTRDVSIHIEVVELSHHHISHLRAWFKYARPYTRCLGYIHVSPVR